MMTDSPTRKGQSTAGARFFWGASLPRLLNFAMLLVLEALLFCAVRRSVPRSAAFLLLALFASTPMVQLVTGSLFVENLLAALVLGAMTAVWRFGEAGEKKFLYVAAALAGSAMAIKVGALVFAVFILFFAIVASGRHWKSLGPRPAASCARKAPALPGILVARPGAYDDFDPSIQFRGDWIQSDEFGGPYRHTVSYAEDAGAEASLVFEGSSLTYVFTKAPNRGMAEILIDGIGKGTADLYFPMSNGRAGSSLPVSAPAATWS